MNHITTERIEDGYKLTFSEPLETSELEYDGTSWKVTQEWMKETDSLRGTLVTILYNSRASLFKTSPSQKILENLLLPLSVVNEKGTLDLVCQLPSPGQTAGKGKPVITGLLIKKAGITPLWTVRTYSENTPVVEFDWNEDGSATTETELREITLIESEDANADAPLRLNTDEEYNARKFAAKERVKEARLKAILARRAAEVETTRYYNDFTTGENESTFSEYDISDFDEEEEESEGEEEQP